MEIIGFKHESVWKVLRKFNFSIDVSTHQELVCIICCNVLKNAHQNKCGCRYCFECIVEYLNNDEKYCPGSTEDCKEFPININLDLQIDHTANRNVANLVVNCPISMCKYTDDLKYMEDHIKSHENKCPFSDFGCNVVIDGFCDVRAHLDNYLNSHLNNLVNHIKDLHETIKELKQDLNMKNERLNTFQQNIQKIIENKNEDIAIFKASNDSLAAELSSAKEKLKSNEKNDIKNKAITKKLQQSIDEIKSKLYSKTREIDDRLDRLDDYYLKSEKKQERLKQQINAVSIQPEIKRIDYGKTSVNKYRNVIIDEIPKMLNYAPFEWKVFGMSEKINQAKKGSSAFIFSEPFYSHARGYKICLKLYPNGNESGWNRFLSVFFCVMKGDYDDYLQWPMTNSLGIQMIDQKSDVVAVFEKFSYHTCNQKEKAVFYQPTEDMNNGLGTSEFIKLNVLSNNSRLFLNNSILIRCLVDV